MMLYEITLTLRPTMYRYTALEQFQMCSEPLLGIFKSAVSVNDDIKISLIAELTQEDNVHYHGIVELKSFKARARLIDRFRRYHAIFGKKSIQQLVNYPLWVQYINKDINKTREVIKDPIVFDDHSVLCDPQYRFVEVPK